MPCAYRPIRRGSRVQAAPMRFAVGTDLTEIVEPVM